MTCQSTQELIPQDIFAYLWESDDDRNGHAAILEVKFWQKDRKNNHRIARAFG